MFQSRLQWTKSMIILRFFPPFVSLILLVPVVGARSSPFTTLINPRSKIISSIRGGSSRDFSPWDESVGSSRRHRPPPPPPPRFSTAPDEKKQTRDTTPPVSSTTYNNPIDYKFAARKASTRMDREFPDEFPQTYAAADFLDYDRAEARQAPQYASPRRDVIARYMSQTNTRALLMLSAGTVGAAIGVFVGKSLFNQPQFFAAIFFLLFLTATLLRNPYGEFVKALGMTLIFALQRSRRIRRRYPTGPHLKAALGAGPRRPFPPTDNPWAYRAVEPSDIEFNMLYSVVAMAFIGSACGGNVPLLPTWLGSLVGAGSFAYLCTTANARGDLFRTMGARVVELTYEVLRINRELALLRKFGVVSGKVLDKILIMDRKHRIKEKLIEGASFAYEQITRSMSSSKNDVQVPGPREVASERGQRRQRYEQREDEFVAREPE